MSSTWADRLEARVTEVGNNICMGMDPVLDKIPEYDSDERSSADRIFNFYSSILAEMDNRDIFPAFVKPNIAYYSSVSIEALVVLKELIELYRARGIHVILDGKRGDIGTSSAMYAKEMFDVFGADSCTVAPYMGSDSVSPFLSIPDKGAFCLLRTSNKGGADLQDLEICAEDGNNLYWHVARRILSWNGNGNIGAVVGATNMGELADIARTFKFHGIEVPWLIPGVGSQGGSATEVMKAIRGAGLTRDFYIINSSSALNFAYLNRKDDLDAERNFAAHCVDALRDLISETEH